MNTEDKKYSSFLREYYDNHKRLIEVIGFTGVITGLFLQVSVLSDKSLKVVQAFLLVVFCVLLSYLLVDFLIRLIAYKKETQKSIAINSTLLTLTIAIFIFSLTRFVYDNFSKELLYMYGFVKFGVIILISAYINEITAFFTNKFGRKKLWLLLNELIFGISYYYIFIYPYYHYNPLFMTFTFLIFAISIPLAFGWVNRRTYFYLLTLIGVTFIFYYNYSYLIK